MFFRGDNLSKYGGIDYLEEFIGKEWLQNEYQRIERKVPFKEVGRKFSNYHPWVCYMYEIAYLIRRAKIEGEEVVVLGKYHYYLNNVGTLLKFNENTLNNPKEIKARLKIAEQFHDVVWELEVGTMLKLLGYHTEFIVPVVGKTYDLSVRLTDRQIAIECKNKIVDNSVENANNLFIHAITTKFENVKELRKKVIQITFERGYFEDIKRIISDIRMKLGKNKQVKILGRYKVKELKKSINASPIEFLRDESVRSVTVIKSILERELYKKINTYEETIGILVFKFPEPEKKLKNVNKVLSIANKQLTEGGVVFLRVPKDFFDSAINDIRSELRMGMRNISAVKIISNEAEMVEGKGVKIWRYEELIVSERDDVTLKLTKSELNILNQNMVFTKYAKAYETSKKYECND